MPLAVADELAAVQGQRLRRACSLRGTAAIQAHRPGKQSMVEGEKHGGKRSGITAALLLPLGPLGFVAMVERAASSFGGGARREAAQQRQGVDDEGRGTQALDGPATRRPMSRPRPRQGKPIISVESNDPSPRG